MEVGKKRNSKAATCQTSVCRSLTTIHITCQPFMKASGGVYHIDHFSRTSTVHRDELPLFPFTGLLPRAAFPTPAS